ncbi:MAG TPA: TRAM domain-containing protein [Acidimicrobiales bacterium]|jgi:tRNA/tmRNA/rRNA uracil-C5-methylase (TrmA/RlmC/RlmD family)|nr:TRAM domain-containing protein [Acidimicrobiales bacterium]
MAKPMGDELLELRVGAIAGGGGCVARAPDGKVVFVRHALPGETVLARVSTATRSYARADAVQILSASPDRVEPPCPHAGPGRCGGCDFQHVELGAQRKLKALRVEELLGQIAGVKRAVEVEPVDGDVAGLGWRTRVRLAVDREGRAGFRRHRSHRVERVDECPVASPAIAATGALRAIWKGAVELDVATGTSAGEAIVSVRPRGPAAPTLPAIDAGLVVRHTVRREPGAVHRDVSGHAYRVSAGVFWQAHQGAARTLLDAVLDATGDCNGETVVDLYAGAGLFAVALARRVGPSGSVLAVERDRRACADARHNGATFPHLVVDQAEVTPELVAGGIGRPSVIVLDPAREGAGIDVTRALSGLTPPLRRVVYVSCDAASFSRDARVLLDEGWELTSLRAFDIFPMTEHVELVAKFEPRSQ